MRTNEGEEKVKKKKKMDKLVLSQFSQLRKRTVLGCFFFFVQALTQVSALPVNISITSGPET